MECNECRNKISLYIDKMLDLEEYEKIEAHLKSCENCMQIYKSTYEMVKVLNKVEIHELPEGFHDDLMSKIREEKLVKTTNNDLDGKLIRRSKNKFSNLRHIASLAAVMLVGFVIFSSMEKNLIEDETYTTPKPRMVRGNMQDANMDESQINSISEIDDEDISGGISAANEWYINTSDGDGFIDVIKPYLDEKKWTYTMSEKCMEITTGDYQELMEWIKTLEIVKDVKVTGDNKPPLKLIISK